MKRIIRSIVIGMALIPSFGALALDLPVRTINGRQYYYYTVKKGDTMNSLILKLDKTRTEIVRSNPSANDILQVGAVLYFPVEKSDENKVSAGSDSETRSDSDGFVYHQVKKKETLYGIGRQYDVDPEDIIKFNPSARYGLKAGATLKIPLTENAKETATAEPSQTAEAVAEVAAAAVPVQVVSDEQQPARQAEDDEVTVKEETADLTPVTPPVLIETARRYGANDDMPSDQSEGIVAEETSEAVTPSGPSSIAVVLPFMLDSENPSRQAILYTDFYKGLMIAADTLSNRGDTVRIFAYDTMGDYNRVKDLLSDSNIVNSSVIIAPDDMSQLDLIGSAVKGGQTKVLNIFSVKDSSYVTNPRMVQANIPHYKMYHKALEALKRNYPDYVPVILRNKTGRSDKAEFVAMLTDDYRSRGVEPVEIAYEGAMTVSLFDDLQAGDSKHVFIPVSGSLSEFNKFSYAVKSLMSAAADPDRYALFGYPDWTAFRGDAQHMLHSLGAMVYSRFFYDVNAFDTRCLNEAFVRWYGEPMIEVVPNQGLLGFDVGNMLIRNIRDNDGYFVPSDVDYDGAQSSFNFLPASESNDAETGCYNDDVYILEFKADGTVERLSL